MRLALIVLLAACGARSTPPSPGPLYAGDEAGLRELDASGKTLRVLTETPVRLFRARASGDLVFVAAQKQAIDPIEIRAIGKDGSGEKVLATIEPTVLCGTEVDYVLGIQSDEDLWLAADGAVCLRLRDDVPASAELERIERVDAAGLATSSLLRAPPGCPEIAPRDPCR